MTVPDFPDWHQAVAAPMTETTLFSGVILAASDAPPIDVSQYESVVILTPQQYLVADFTLDQAGTQLVQELVVPGGGYPVRCTGAWMLLTNSLGVNATVTVIGTNRRLDQSLMNVGTNIGHRAHTGSIAMAAGQLYTLLAEVGTIPFGLCSLWVQISGATTTLGILNALQATGATIEIWDTNLVSANGTGIGRTDQRLVSIPAGTSSLTFSCTVAGTSDVRAALVSAN